MCPRGACAAANLVRRLETTRLTTEMTKKAPAWRPMWSRSASGQIQYLLMTYDGIVPARLATTAAPDAST